MTLFFEPKDLPNQDAFRFIGFDQSGDEHYCIVRTGKDGQHYMRSNTMLFSDLMKWRHESSQQKREQSFTGTAS